MEGMPEKKFNTPEEEIAFLRQQIANKEQALLDRNKEVDPHDTEVIGREVIQEYAEHAPSQVLTKEHEASPSEVAGAVETAAVAHDKTHEIFSIAQEKGIKNALTVLEKMGDSYLTDEVHRQLVHDLRQGKIIGDLKEGMPLWNVLHMTLFEVAFTGGQEETNVTQYREVVSGMQQFYAGMQTLGSGKTTTHYTLEIGVSDKRDDIIFYVGIPTEFVDLFEKQVLSLFPTAVITEQQNDYNIFVDGGESEVSVAELKNHPIYPLQTAEEFEQDPLAVMLNAFSKIERDGGGAAVQFVIQAKVGNQQDVYQQIIKRVQDGVKPSESIQRSTVGGELVVGVKDLFKSKPKDESNAYSAPEVDTDAVELFNKKIGSQIISTNVRIVASAANGARAGQILTEVESGFNQFENPRSNRIEFKRQTGSKKNAAVRAYSFREYKNDAALALSLEELSVMMHFPANGLIAAPQLKEAGAKTAPAPVDMPSEGTLIGINAHRNVEREIYVTREDRVRHFYVIGQTGTGKTVFIKNMIIQDILRGDGVCMIDPHGTDLEDVLGAIPEERIDDVIYFDPARQDKVLALNMLEFDPTKPEQKTFVINELFSIFQKLFSSESMGPMFEQYFRNAAGLILEDPESGSTLMDISRVLADAEFRKMKLSRATNPVVVQFWTEIATKAGGEASLENIIPYITSKFDIFTANDFLRPVVGQQVSTFNMRDVMDTKKILLINLSKGRIGEINANLLGMVIVGKILMAALSRVDDPTKGFPPFYLYIDEFQNVTTDSISAILSEARKYKLGLTVAHQFTAQLDPGIKDAIFGNVGNMAAFRVGAEDAEFLTQQFGPVFDANDLMNIPNWNAYAKILANGVPAKPFSFKSMPPFEAEQSRVERYIEASYAKYGRPKRKVEMEIASKYGI